MYICKINFQAFNIIAMQYHVVTFTHTKIFGWAVYLYAHVKYLKKLLKEDKLVAGDPYSIHCLAASSTVNLWDSKFGDFK